MVEFETIDAKEIKIGKTGFLEIAAKRAITDSGDKPFISMTKGFYQGKSRIYKQILTLPQDKAVLATVIDCLKGAAK